MDVLPSMRTSYALFVIRFMIASDIGLPSSNSGSIRPYYWRRISVWGQEEVYMAVKRRLEGVFVIEV